MSDSNMVPVIVVKLRGKACQKLPFHKEMTMEEAVFFLLMKKSETGSCSENICKSDAESVRLAGIGIFSTCLPFTEVKVNGVCKP